MEFLEQREKVAFYMNICGIPNPEDFVKVEKIQVSEKERQRKSFLPSGMQHGMCWHGNPAKCFSVEIFRLGDTEISLACNKLGRITAIDWKRDMVRFFPSRPENVIGLPIIHTGTTQNIVMTNDFDEECHKFLSLYKKAVLDF